METTELQYTLTALLYVALEQLGRLDLGALATLAGLVLVDHLTIFAALVQVALVIRVFRRESPIARVAVNPTKDVEVNSTSPDATSHGDGSISANCVLPIINSSPPLAPEDPPQNASEEVSVFVKDLSGRTLCAHTDGSVESIVSVVSDRVGLPSEQVVLSLGGRPVPPSGVPDCATVQVGLRMLGGADSSDSHSGEESYSDDSGDDHSRYFGFGYMEVASIAVSLSFNYIKFVLSVEDDLLAPVFGETLLPQIKHVFLDQVTSDTAKYWLEEISTTIILVLAEEDDRRILTPSVYEVYEHNGKKILVLKFPGFQISTDCIWSLKFVRDGKVTTKLGVMSENAQERSLRGGVIEIEEELIRMDLERKMRILSPPESCAMDWCESSSPTICTNTNPNVVRWEDSYAFTSTPTPTTPTTTMTTPPANADFSTVISPDECGIWAEIVMNALMFQNVEVTEENVAKLLNENSVLPESLRSALLNNLTDAYFQ